MMVAEEDHQAGSKDQQGPAGPYLVLLLSCSINVMTKTTYNSHSYNGPSSIILVYSAGGLLQLHLFFSLLHFSIFMIDCSQPLTSFYFLWIFSSYSLALAQLRLVVFSLLVVVFSLLDFFLPFYFTLISSSRLLTILAPKAGPTPNQKPSSPIPINNPILLSSSLLGSLGTPGPSGPITSSCWVPHSSRCNHSTCLFLFSIFIMLR